MSKKKKRAKTDPPPYTTYALSGGTPLSPDAGTTKPSESSAEEMRLWSHENQQ